MKQRRGQGKNLIRGRILLSAESLTTAHSGSTVSELAFLVAASALAARAS
jgi:hypothetical protein